MRQLIDDKKIVCVSGGFDPIHIGHVRMIQDAAKLGHVIVIANSGVALQLISNNRNSLRTG